MGRRHAAVLLPPHHEPDRGSFNLGGGGGGRRGGDEPTGRNKRRGKSVRMFYFSPRLVLSPPWVSFN